jgi:hypothetical protein
MDSRSTPLNLGTNMSSVSQDGNGGLQELISIPGIERLPPLGHAQYLLDHFVSDDMI